MPLKKSRVGTMRIFLFLLFPLLILPGCGRKDAISSQEKAVVDKILKHWETWVPARKADGTAPLINFEQLYQGQNEEARAFLDKIKNLKPGGRLEVTGVDFFKLTGQELQKKGRPAVIDPQYLPRWTYERYRAMMREMKKDIGKILLVESGYRSPAYQLYTFLFYMPKHHYSVSETNRWVAFPGHSEHGNPDVQAIDFINQQGINGDDEGQTPETFEKLPEYEWLQKNAGKFGFELSYPRGGKETVYEPWHWRFPRLKQKT